MPTHGTRRCRATLATLGRDETVSKLGLRAHSGQCEFRSVVITDSVHRDHAIQLIATWYLAKILVRYRTHCPRHPPFNPQNPFRFCISGGRGIRC